MCQGNKKCTTCQIAGLFNTSKMKKPKLNFKGVTQTLMGGASGAALKIGFNFALSTIDKNGQVTGMKRHLASLALPIVASIIAPKITSKPMVQNAIIGHNAITIFEAAKENLPAEMAAKVSGYDPYAMAGYSPDVMAGVRNLPYMTKSAVQ